MSRVNYYLVYLYWILEINDQFELPMFNQQFSNTEGRLDSKLEHNLPSVNEPENKKIFTL